MSANGLVSRPILPNATKYSSCHAFCGVAFLIPPLVLQLVSKCSTRVARSWFLVYALAYQVVLGVRRPLRWCRNGEKAGTGYVREPGKPHVHRFLRRNPLLGCSDSDSEGVAGFAHHVCFDST